LKNKVDENWFNNITISGYFSSQLKDWRIIWNSINSIQFTDSFVFPLIMLIWTIHGIGIWFDSTLSPFLSCGDLRKSKLVSWMVSFKSNITGCFASQLKDWRIIWNSINSIQFTDSFVSTIKCNDIEEWYQSMVSMIPP